MKPTFAQRAAAALLAVLALTAHTLALSADKPAAKVDGAFIRANALTTNEWPSHGLDYAETRFSRLDRINTSNVKDLGLVWSYNLESTRATLEDGRTLDVLDVEVEVEVSSGTYVRALARDLGAALGVGGHLTALRRTRVGRFDLSAAVPLAELVGHVERGGADAVSILPLAAAARAQLPVHEVTVEEARRLGHGQRIASAADRADSVAAIDPDGRLVAILDETRGEARARVVFAPAD